jgi:hypothetical protein
MGRSGSSWGSKCRHLVAMTRKDAANFSDSLKKAFPNIRFLPEEYSAKWSETWRWAPVLSEMRYRGFYRFKPRMMRDPTGEALIYYDSLADSRQFRYTAWVEPPGWEPEWAWDENSGIYVLVNKPKLFFEFRRSAFSRSMKPDRPANFPREMLYWGPDTRTSDPPPINQPDTVVTLLGDRMVGFWDPGDEEAKAFVGKVFRIASKLTTNKFRWVDEDTMHPLPGVHSAVHEWAGHDAVRWAHERRHNYLIRFNKPADYDFGDEPLTSFEEVEKRNAERRRRFVEEHGIDPWS